MKTIVCVKPVPGKLIHNGTDGEDSVCINPYDLYSLKNEVQYKKKYGGEITVLSMGAPTVQPLLYRCLAMGGDEAILLSDTCFAGSDTYVTAFILSKAIQKLHWDRIVCGHTALDGETGQVYGEVAASLGCICLSSVLACSQDECGNQYIQYYDNGFVETVKTKTPIVLSYLEYTTSESVSLMELKKARKKQVQVWNRESLGLETWECGQAGSKTRVISSSSMERSGSRNAQICMGTPEEACDILYKKMENFI